MGERDRLHGLFLKTRNYSDWCNFKAACNAVKTELIKAQINHVYNEVMKHKNNTGSLWKIINHTVAYNEKETVVYSKDPKIVAEEFNHLFSSVGENTDIAASQLLQDYNIYPDIPPTTVQGRNSLRGGGGGGVTPPPPPMFTNAILSGNLFKARAIC